jgi:hypothetical protein
VTFAWDPAKNAASLARRGFDYAFASLIFDARTVEREDDRRAYGERRIIALGVADGIPLTVVYTDRQLENHSIQRRVISARLSGRKKRRQYAQALKTEDAHTGQG